MTGFNRSLIVVTLPTIQTTFFFFFNDTATTEIYTLSLHDALPIFTRQHLERDAVHGSRGAAAVLGDEVGLEIAHAKRSEEHTSELQSQSNLVCRLLLEKKKNKTARETADNHTNTTRDNPEDQSASN